MMSFVKKYNNKMEWMEQLMWSSVRNDTHTCFMVARKSDVHVLYKDTYFLDCFISGVGDDKKVYILLLVVLSI